MSTNSCGSIQKYRVEFSDVDGLTEQFQAIEIKEHETLKLNNLDLRITCVGNQAIITLPKEKSGYRETSDFTSGIVLENDPYIKAELPFYPENQGVTLFPGNCLGNQEDKLFLTPWDLTDYQAEDSAPTGKWYFGPMSNVDIRFVGDSDKFNVVSKSDLKYTNNTHLSNPHLDYKVDGKTNNIIIRDLGSVHGTAISLNRAFENLLDWSFTPGPTPIRLSLNSKYKYWEKHGRENTSPIISTRFVVTNITDEKITKKLKEILVHPGDASQKVSFYFK